MVTALPARYTKPASSGTGKLRLDRRLNNDGKIDVVALSYQNPCKCISVLLGNGDGTFQAPVTTEPPTFVATAIGVGDFDRDGKLDLAEFGPLGPETPL